MRAHTWITLCILGLLALAYIIPYTILSNPRGWGLYVFWTLLSIMALILAWVGVRYWRGELS